MRRFSLYCCFVLVLFSQGCIAWTPYSGNLASITYRDKRIRVELANSRRIIVDRPIARADSLFGLANQGEIALPAAAITRFEVRRVDATLTVLAVAAGVFAAAVIYAVYPREVRIY